MFSCLVFKKHYCYKLGNILGKKDFFLCLFIFNQSTYFYQKEEKRKMLYKGNFVSNSILKLTLNSFRKSQP